MHFLKIVNNSRRAKVAIMQSIQTWRGFDALSDSKAQISKFWKKVLASQS